MPAPERMFRKDWVLVWPATGKDRFNKWRRSADHIEIKVRWQGRQRVLTSDPQGKPVSIDVTISSPRELPIGTPVWKGTYKDLADNNLGTDHAGLIPLSNIYEVVGNDTSRDHRGKTNGFLVYLRRLGDTMPDVA
jgi:hypothetical protein